MNIVKNPGHVYFKGNGILTIAGQKLDFRKMNGDFAISSSLLDSVESIQVLGSSVITIENLTTFNAFDPSEMFAIYLGGYHNRVRREFIKKVYEQNREKTYYHYGDIDAGGFYILEHLKRKTGVIFQPYRMDRATLQENIEHTKKLTENDRKRLEGLRDSEYGSTIQFMLEENCKLEQEALD